MKTDRDPPPLDDPAADVPDLLRDALSAARADLPDPAKLASLSAGLKVAVSAPAAAAPSILSGALIGGALGVLVSGAAVLLPSRSEPPMVAPPPPTEIVNLATSAVPAAPAPSSETSPVPVTTSAPRPPRPAPPPAASSAPAPLPPPSSPAPTARSDTPPQGDLASEVYLLQRALRAMKTNPAEALSLTTELAARFPRGVLIEERESVAIQALAQLGRRAEASARAKRFVASYPRSAHWPRIEALAGE